VTSETASRPFADSVASIDARRLYRLGLFGSTPETIFVRSQLDSAESPELEIRVSWDPQARAVHLSTPERPRGQTIAVGRRALPRGGGYYFICPIAGERCEKLYYVDGAWGGRRAHRLSYSSQSGSLADRHRHSVRRLTGLIEHPAAHPMTPERRAEIEARIERLERKIAALPRRSVRQRSAPQGFADLIPLAGLAAPVAGTTGPALGVEAALDRGSAAGDVEDSVGWLFHRADHLRALAGRAPEGLADRIRALRPGFGEDHPRISLRALEGRGLVRPGWRRGAVLDWTGLGCGLDRCTILLDLRDDDFGFAAFEIVTGREAVEQALRIVRSTGGELRFVCPLTGAEVETIAFRAGGFAAPEALRLTRRPGRA
jgi:hypothetical protein